MKHLCYEHYSEEFKKLTDRHLAFLDWRTVEPCEVCKAESDALLEALGETHWLIGTSPIPHPHPRLSGARERSEAMKHLCYEHYSEEFKKLTDRHLALDWRTVEPCEVCKAESDALLEALEALYTATAAMLIGLGETLDVSMDDDDFPPQMRQAIEQARAAVADARAGRR